MATAHPEGDRIKITLNSKQRIEALADRTDSDTGYSAQLCVREKKEMVEKTICILLNERDRKNLNEVIVIIDRNTFIHTKIVGSVL